jgi:Transglutaminase-like superfamily
MLFLLLHAYAQLIRLELFLLTRDFPRIYQTVRTQPVRERRRESYSEEQICAAVDIACVWYWRHVLCLQRAAATALLLRRNGVAAELVVGVQQIPFRAHAWVEVETRVVNDKHYLPTIYSILDRW